MEKIYVNYGCGVCAPEEWMNFDASPTLLIQKTPVIGCYYKRDVVCFPSNVMYGNIIKGLPGIKNNSCDGIYCSHVLEHLSLEDCRVVLKNTYNMLKKEGIFRFVIPDLDVFINKYLEEKSLNRPDALYNFLKNTHLGQIKRDKGLKGLLADFLGNSKHLWMWNKESMNNELEKAGFVKIRECSFNDCEDKMFKLVENSERFNNSIAFECIK